MTRYQNNIIKSWCLKSTYFLLPAVAVAENLLLGCQLYSSFELGWPHFLNSSPSWWPETDLLCVHSLFPWPLWSPSLVPKWKYGKKKQNSATVMQIGNSITFMPKSLVIAHAATAPTSGNHCAITGKVLHCSIHLRILFVFHFGIMCLNNPSHTHQTVWY